MSVDCSISVLMSVYYRDDPDYLHLALKSIWTDQKLKPIQVVLVKDGVVSERICAVIDHWNEELEGALKVITLPQNKGLANALNKGLSFCKGEYIARMDSDDISLSNRFSLQSHFLSENTQVDVVGTYIKEINEHGLVIKEIIKYPTEHLKMLDFFSKRDPLAHPTVMFRRSFFEKAGAYSEQVHLAEDTLLWFQGFAHGCIFANIKYVGLKYRRSNLFYKRRGDLRKSIMLLRYRLLVINRELNYGLIANLFAFMYFVMSFMPSSLKKYLYNRLR